MPGRFILRFTEMSMPSAQKQANMIRRDGYLARIRTRRTSGHFFFDVYEGRKRK